MRTIDIKHILVAGTVASALAATAGIAFAQESAVRRMSSGSIDGDRTSYVVQCTDGTRGTVYVLHEESNYCAIAQGGSLRCVKNWTLKNSAVHACTSGAK
jgi:hypothetical protein